MAWVAVLALVGGVTLALWTARADAAAASQWTIQPMPNPGRGHERVVSSVSCPSTTACVAVGSFTDGAGNRDVLAMRWNGKRWAADQTPNPIGSRSARFLSVSCPSSRTCIAVGSSDTATGSTVLVERWDGSAWTFQRSPKATRSALNAISCASTNACMAVGSAAGHLLAERWNGTTWTMQPIPDLKNGVLTALSCSSTTACIAVGVAANSANVRVPLAARWNGGSWTVQRLSGSAPGSGLESVSCTSSSACIAVGGITPSSGAKRPLAERWNGTAWTIQRVSSPSGAPSTSLLGVSCAAKTACTAVGQSGAATLAERWNSTTWAIQATPNPTGVRSSQLLGVACPSQTTCSAVGSSRTVTSSTLVAEHYSAAVINPGPTPQTWANRAVATYAALQKYFYVDDGTGLYRETYPYASGKPYSYLWPFSRALVGTLTLAGIPASLVGGRSYQSDVSDRLAALGHYWDTSVSPPGYDSYVVSPLGGGGDKFYDDQAWIGLALAQHYRMTATASSLSGAQAVLSFVYPGGWDNTSSDPYPGGTYWVQQGVGTGTTNHDRTATSNAPNGELAFQLEQFDPDNATVYDAAGAAMQQWVAANLYNVNSSGLVYDKVARSGTIDMTLWTYNQGALIGADVMRYRLTGQTAYLSQAKQIATTALNYFSESSYVTQPTAFNAIYFRGLLQLYSVSGDTALNAAIMRAMQTYANDAWNSHRSPDDLFSFSSSTGSYQLLDQAAMLQIFAALAWNTSDYPKLG